jgi:hypothetical protein
MSYLNRKMEELKLRMHVMREKLEISQGTQVTM